MKAWFDDPKELIKAKEILQFWPTNKQSPEERVNAASRFVIYATCFLYLIRRDIRVFVLGATVLGVLYVMYKSKMIKETYGRPTFGGQGCQMPSIAGSCCVLTASSGRCRASPTPMAAASARSAT